MKNAWLSIGLACALGASSAVALAETVETTQTTTTQHYGTVTEVTPSSSTIIMRAPDEPPATYSYSKKTVFLDPSGNVASAELMRGQPVTIYYHNDGATLVVDKVVMS